MTQYAKNFIQDQSIPKVLFALGIIMISSHKYMCVICYIKGTMNKKNTFKDHTS